MEHKLQRLDLFVGLALYLFDYGSDIYVAVQHWNNDERWWFGLTVGFICVPSLIVNLTAIFQYVNIWTCIAAILQLSIVARYIEVLVKPRASIRNVFRTHSLAILRYVETITESSPQWCLQVYIMLRQWSFPSYTVVSSVFSMLSLAWSITTLEKEKKKRHSEELTLINAFLFWIWQMSTLISRLSAIVLFAYVFRYCVVIALVAHWLILVWSIYLIERYNGSSSGKSILLSLMAGCSSLVHSAENDLPTKCPKPEMIVGYIFLVLVSIIMVTLSLITPDVAHMDVLKPVAIASAAGGTFVSIVFCILYYFCGRKWFHWSVRGNHQTLYYIKTITRP